ncbi:CtsR family transcriptional regulator [Selenomonas dianae]|uniref:Transcriptional regulator CtsR n=1 Tax=Selenomonas dianae TaxID=135079 RepID=A0ABP3CF23_9FIRM|nr:CtsR family transcriptional regulator [Selenomonas dianae]WLD83138.1 CtsR family transcriptional regulator [Selenomonas dianae]
MSNIADMIESYILRQLASRQDGQVELRRTEIADEISCAPSQISYVLATRFTQDRGFVVESRRGLGGFIRIVQVPLHDLVYRDMMSKIDENTDMETVQSMVRYLAQHGMVETREAALLMQMVTGLFHSETLAAKERVQMLKTMISTLENFR